MAIGTEGPREVTPWRVVDLLDYRGELCAARGRLTAADQEIPLSDVNCLLLGSGVTLGAGVPHLAARFGVALLSCDWRGVPIAATTGWSSNSRVGARHQAQCSLSNPRRKNAWMRIVKAKLRGQANNLDRSNPEVSLRIRHLAAITRSGDLENREAQGARTYWTRMFDRPGFTRAPGSSEGANVLLNYGYGVLRGAITRAVISAGLIPALGLHHVNRANAFALADDLIEPFRPAVDWVVRALPSDAWLSDPGVKASIVGVLKLPQRPGAQSVQSEISHLAQRLGHYVESDTKVLSVLEWEASANG